MNDLLPIVPSRKAIAMRLLYTLLFLVAFELVKTAVQLAVVFQYIYLFITQKPCEPVRRFANQAATYAYVLLRYASLNANARPYPFAAFPAEKDLPETGVSFE
jgi:hypothetical protein